MGKSNKYGTIVELMDDMHANKSIATSLAVLKEQAKPLKHDSYERRVTRIAFMSSQGSGFCTSDLPKEVRVRVEGALLDLVVVCLQEELAKNETKLQEAAEKLGGEYK